ncbi:MAG: hypothetical protein K5643_04130 [Saccharofermentans sp.]|nr:hypothetical protein [Saccharofermentans sp.]
MSNDISEMIGWKCSCGQTGNMGKFCFSCGKVQPLVGAQRAVPEQIKATFEEKETVEVTDSEETLSEEKVSSDQPAASAVSEYYDYSGERAEEENTKDEAQGEETVYASPAGRDNASGKGLGIAGMVTGIVSCVLFFIPVIGVASGTCGMIMTIKAKDRGNLTGFTKAGTICSAIGCSVGFLMLFRLFI